MGKNRINKTVLGGLALRGFDAVAYFTERRPVKGSKDFTYEWAGASWRFASQANRDLFIADPHKYAPQYGGYCAWGISQGKFFDGDPEVWKLMNDKLYVNYNKDIETTWEQDIPGFVASADRNWPAMEPQ